MSKSPAHFDFFKLFYESNARRLGLATLVRLRWLAIFGQAVSILFVRFGLGFELPLFLCFAVLAISASANLALQIWIPPSRRLDDRPATVLLAFDICQLAALLCLTGGIDNPFGLLIVSPVVVSAVTLPRSSTLALFVLATGFMFALIFYHWPLPWAGENPPYSPSLYRAGVWCALVIGAAFACIYTGRVAEEARALSDALAATELALEREQHLSQLDGLAAACAHELGTPLATIALVARELSRDPNAGAFEDDFTLLIQQSQRCREILGRLRALESEQGDFARRKTLEVMLDQVCEPHREYGVDVKIATHGEGREPERLHTPSIQYGLSNIIENAVDYATGHVEVLGRWTPTKVEVFVTDDGPGFAPEVLRLFGAPYLTRRPNERKTKSESGGLGLGLFIAKTLLERSGARVAISNRLDTAHGALVHIEWTRVDFEKEEAQS